MPPLAPATELPGVGSFIIGCIIALASGFFTALSMNVNRWALAHAEPQRVRFVPCIVQPWMMWIWAMFLYNVGATALASVAQLFIPLSLFAPIFITLLVFNLIIARWWLKEEITGAKVAGAFCIIVGAVLTGAGTPLTSVPLQVEYPCVRGNKLGHKILPLALPAHLSKASLQGVPPARTQSDLRPPEMWTPKEIYPLNSFNSNKLRRGKHVAEDISVSHVSHIVGPVLDG